MCCGNEQRETVKEQLTAVFRRYGLPRRILCDNGLPWGVPASRKAERSLYTRLNAWLFRLGIDVVHGRPYHPETQGKNERFHRSLNEEVLQQGSYESLSECQAGFDRWRRVYNLKRPHEALGLEVPSSHYQPSGRPFPETLPEIRYPSAEHVHTVGPGGQIWFAGTQFYVGEAFGGHPVALRQQQAREKPEQSDAEQPDAEQPDAEQPASTQQWAVYFCHKQIHLIDAKPPTR